MTQGVNFAATLAMNSPRHNIALATANILLGANFSCYVALTHSGIEFGSIFMLQIICAAIFFIPAIPGSHRNIDIEDFGTIFIVALMMVYGWQYMLLWGSSNTNPIDGSIIATLGPLITLLAAHIADARRMKRWRALGVGIAFAGVAVLLFDRGRIMVGDNSEGYGNALVLAAVMAGALNTLLLKRQLQRYGTARTLGWCYAIAIVVTTPFFAPDLHGLTARLTPTIVAELLYVTLGGTVAALYLLYLGTAHLTTTQTAIYRYLQPLTATLLALLRGQSSIDAANIVGIMFIFGGILLVALTDRQKRARQPR